MSISAGISINAFDIIKPEHFNGPLLFTASTLRVHSPWFSNTFKHTVSVNYLYVPAGRPRTFPLIKFHYEFIPKKVYRRASNSFHSVENCFEQILRICIVFLSLKIYTLTLVIIKVFIRRSDA
ncbi:hypothetical protein SCEN_J01340 [Saccharomyces cerevisiae]|uniref:Putative uncharacterized protein YJL086C n=2 Tax=Saccharomyces cerevisiae TaxID=4932 RepID=YJI6_YEAST|nr:RecName: Full=Putative uncharacterized protein YJL086C [Saccharomyces cerevisiae S288C]AAA66920.1 unknown protein [Saccharomyces cerevisiae]WNV73314.1 hypothetical protein O6U65_1216 [Saccharomyces cerevisiae synthetic construct]CAY80693.2 EC1118_1J11_1607p [Saccharomyces cerevisiae EC1118]AAS56576.1 YJL086C [Saccharomyces cerevisiae]QHB09542.1 hypothetical protein SCEN_J01340 [Saccharomyces cerevisiae]